MMLSERGAVPLFSFREIRKKSEIFPRFFEKALDISFIQVYTCIVRKRKAERQKGKRIMMKQEFEKIAGYEVSISDYENIIEPMYMATDLTKEEFVKVIDKKRFALKTRRQSINEMRKIAKHLKDICGHCKDIDAEDKLEELARAFTTRFYTNANFQIEDAKKYEFGCYFPRTIEIYSLSDFRTIEEINLQ